MRLNLALIGPEAGLPEEQALTAERAPEHPAGVWSGWSGLRTRDRSSELQTDHHSGPCRAYGPAPLSVWTSPRAKRAGRVHGYYPPGIPTQPGPIPRLAGLPDHVHVRVSAHHALVGDHWDMYI